MPTALSASDYIWEGAWINWTRGRVLGLTLTLNPSKTAIVSPALALYISIAGSQLWTLLRLALHQTRATNSPKSLYYHQQQTVLRNTGSDLNALWQLLRVAFAWRHQRGVKVLQDSLPLILYAFLHFAFILLAGLFSSWLLESNDSRVLSRSPWCGTFSDSYLNQLYFGSTFDLNTEWGSHQDHGYATVQQHVDLCDATREDCNILPNQPLPSTSKLASGQCPFAQSACHPDVHSSMSFDTGYMSSHSAFGFNSRPEDRVSFRMTAQCAPLDDSKYTTDWQDAASSADSQSPGPKVADALYGSRCDNGNNATYSIKQFDMACGQRINTQPYALSSAYYCPQRLWGTKYASFWPIQELNLSTADLSLAMLSSVGTYTEPVNDPWFSAHRWTYDNNTDCEFLNTTSYARDRPLTTIGCSQQWQVCNAHASTSNPSDNDGCTPLLGIIQLQNFLIFNSTSLFTVKQNVTASRIANVAQNSLFFTVIDRLSTGTAPPLKARDLMSYDMGTPLPDNQWQIETDYWWRIVLGYLQQSSLDYSTGQFAASTDYINVTKPSSDPSQKAAYNLCQNQMIEMETWRSYNLFALILTVIIATIIIILGLTIEDIMAFIRQRRLRHSGEIGKQDIWVANSDLEMLKTIDELKHGTTWTRSKNGVPLPDHKSNHISISELTNDHLTVEQDVSIVTATIKNHMSDEKNTKISQKADPDSSPFTFEWGPVDGPVPVHEHEHSTKHKDDFNQNSNPEDNERFVNTYTTPFTAPFQDRIWLQGQSQPPKI